MKREKGLRRTTKSKQLRDFSNVEVTISLALALCKIILVSPAPEEDSPATSRKFYQLKNDRDLMF